MAKYLIPCVARGQCSKKVMSYIFVMDIKYPFSLKDREREVMMRTRGLELHKDLSSN